MVRILFQGELVQFDGQARLVYRSGIVHGPPLRFPREGGQLQALRIGTSQRSGNDGDHDAQMVQNERDLLHFPTEEMVQSGQGRNHHHPGPDQDEWPEPQHLAQPRHPTHTYLRKQAHQYGKGRGVHQTGNGRSRMHHPLESIDFTTQREHHADSGQQQDQHDQVDRPGKELPPDGARRHLQQHSRKKKASSDEEALLHFPRFNPHAS